MDILRLPLHFFTVCAVNAQTCLNRYGIASETAEEGKIVLKKPRLFATIRGTYESLAEFYIVEETAARDLTHF